jgi:hypothetical protein
MKSIYYIIGGSASAVLGGLLIWKNRTYIKNTSTRVFGSAKSKARSAYGRVAATADEVFHTERNPKPAGIGS